ncbi:MAG: 4a-hydroxytetrahydrobiopterin dehydratase [Candidatus Omnitrophica bacterium]|nr:4a-hydroxytetrahydrobiopterin dehydratase [Candidatus Omnitrophota bacterium]
MDPNSAAQCSLLSEKRCVPCEGGVEKLQENQIQELLKKIDGWSVEQDKLRKTFQFKNFIQAIGFINQAAIAAEVEGHHPDFCVHYNKVDFIIWTHAIGGLSENDFILAAKLDALLP